MCPACPQAAGRVRAERWKFLHSPSSATRDTRPPMTSSRIPAARSQYLLDLLAQIPVRLHGETKTQRSRRTLALPAVAVQALRDWSRNQAGKRLAAGERWQDTGLVFTNHLGAALDAGTSGNVQTGLHRGRDRGRLDTARDADHARQPAEPPRGQHRGDRPAGRHASTRTTEIVYRRELRPVIATGAEIMDELFSGT
jgi:hypothetical protein